MTTDQFAYWLQGYMEVAKPERLDEVQTQIIKDHLDLVFKKETPDRENPVVLPYPSTTPLPGIQPFNPPPFHHTIPPFTPYNPTTVPYQPPYTVTCGSEKLC